jgi:broad specificity polyphosphatase/5'/3'-nucleotidase SurE
LKVYVDSTGARGLCEFIEKYFIALYKDWNNTLVLNINFKNFQIDEYFSIFYTEDMKKNVASLVIKRQEAEVQIEYSIMKCYQVSTIYYTEDYEDANFGFWLYSILTSEERKKIFLSNW